MIQHPTSECIPKGREIIEEISALLCSLQFIQEPRHGNNLSVCQWMNG